MKNIECFDANELVLAEVKNLLKDEVNNIIYYKWIHDLEIEVNGARNIKNIFPDALLIYIAPPSLAFDWVKLEYATAVPLSSI